MSIKVKTPVRGLSAQAEQMHVIWEALINLAPRLRSALPSEVLNAKARMGASESDHSRLSGDYQLYAFYRLASAFQQHKEPLTMGEISEELTVPLSSATRVVDWLVSTGYAERQPDPRDRRIVRVAMTESGSALYGACNHFFTERIHEFLGHFTVTERQQLVALGQKTIQVLEKMNP